jgi:hypothetical protein
MLTSTLPLELTGLETVFLTDAIKNDDAAQGLPDRDSYFPLAREALLLLGSAYVELVHPDGIAPGPVTLQVSEEVAWLLRGKVKTGDIGIDGQTNVGVPLLMKLYRLLLSFNAEVVGLPPVCGEDATLTAFDKYALDVHRRSEGV